MKKSSNLKHRLIAAVLTLVMLVSSLLGTTFAWFTDQVTSAGNKIESGNLQIDLSHKHEDAWVSLKQDPNHKVFDYDKWEPGYTGVEALKIDNLGSLALQYRLSLDVDYGTATLGVNGERLSDVIEVYVSYGERSETGFAAIKGSSDWTYKGTLTAVMQNPTSFFAGELLPTGKTLDGNAAATTKVGSETLSIALHMKEDAGNEYQKLSVGDVYVNLTATQWSYEGDAFGTDYDTDSAFPELDLGDVVFDVNALNNIVQDEVNATGTGVSATVPAGVTVDDGVSKLGLTVTEKTESDANITLNDGEALRALDVHIKGVSKNNTVPMYITVEKAMKPGLNLGNYKLYHVENGVSNEMTVVSSLSELDAHNEIYYDPATGDVTLAMATFSEVALVAETTPIWDGNVATDFAGGTGEGNDPYLIANADQFVYFGDLVSNSNEDYGSKHYRLLADINLGGETNAGKGIIFYPIGYYKKGADIAALDVDDAPEFLYFEEDPDYARGTASAVAEEGAVEWYTYGGSFKGTFDGNGNKISNIYQNTWQMKGNYSGNYWDEAMGVFGYVNGGTVKNLTVDGFTSDGEFTPTGVIAAYAANATFENIAITNCNPRVYNTGNGGIVGIGGNSSDPDTYKLTFTNITIDNTNKISALWGSWDVACGGLVGMFRGAGHVYMTNCHVAAQIDVFNDVCGNYQYYWYRYSGMMIGTNRNMITDKDGYTVPETAKFHAENCTVHFGDWNDYYYCELVANSLASYTHDHQFSRLTQIQNVSEIQDANGNWSTTGNFIVMNGKTPTETCYHIMKDAEGNLYEHKHNVADATNKDVYETKDINGDGVVDSDVLKENNQRIYLPFNQLFTGYGWGVKHIPVYNGDKYAFDGITILDREVADSVEKFETKFTGDFLYRVGNGNAVSLGALFGAKGGATINDSGVWVTVHKVNDSSNVSGVFTANTSDWTKGTVKFSGTGVVKVTIQDYDYCIPTELYLEVVDATNTTGAANATANNVVLLADSGFNSLEVSGGYTLYGNGFTLTCAQDSAALDMGYSFVTLNSGTLDNVQIVCPNYDYAALYKSNLTSSDNRSETTDKVRYFNAKSGVMSSGNSQILNSRISGARAAVNVSGGNLTIDNSRIELGAVATILVGSANSLTLKDVTLIQKPTASTYDANKKLMGFSVLYICDSEGKATPTTIEGGFVQQAWVCEDDKQYVPSAGQSIVDGVMQETAFIHSINGKDSLNLGFAYMPEDAQKTVAAPDNITDNRTDKATIPYELKNVKIQLSLLSTTVYVYSYKNTNGTAESFKTETAYAPNKYGDIITVSYSDAEEGLTKDKSYGTDGWVYELNVDLDKLSGYALDFGKMSMSINGVTVTDFKVNGSAKPTTPVTVVAGGTIYTLTATMDGKEYTATYKVTGTETSKESPSLVGTPSYGEGFGVANKYGGDWSAAAPVLDGITIKYWSVADSEYKEFALSSITFASNGKQNGTNNYWEYTHTNNDFTLKLTNTAVMHSSSGTYGMPVAGSDGKLYFTIASSGGFVSTGTTARSITIAYEFNDNNGGTTLKFSNTWNIAYAKDEQYNYSSFTNDGTMEKLASGSSSGGTCITPDTLITLADGTQVRVDSLTGNEELLVWNMTTGKLDSAPIMFIDSDPAGEYEVIKLYFSDGTAVNAIYEHGFWDYDLNRYVYLDSNADKYIGHTFAKQSCDTLDRVTLVDVVIETENTTAWSPVTAGHLCYFVNGMLSMPGGVGGLFNIFEVDAKTMTYDAQQMAKDIEEYGLYTYEELNAICPLSEEMFNAAGGAYLKVSIGKGNLTEEELIGMINRYSKFFD